MKDEIRCVELQQHAQLNFGDSTGRAAYHT